MFPAGGSPGVFEPDFIHTDLERLREVLVEFEEDPVSEKLGISAGLPADDDDEEIGFSMPMQSQVMVEPKPKRQYNPYLDDVYHNSCTQPT